MKIEEIQSEVRGKPGVDGGENNNKLCNGLEDRYKHDRQQLILSPSLCERNLWVDNHQDGTTSWMTWISESKGHDVDKSRRQKRKYI